MAIEFAVVGIPAPEVSTLDVLFSGIHIGAVSQFH